MSNRRILVVGGGAAGYFAAITAAQKDPEARVVIAEGSSTPLKKVSISGGGRCNVTNATFDSKDLVSNYPRGERELIGAFNRFGPQDTIDWFEQRGVRLKTEEDLRVFPKSDSSDSIVQCFEENRQKLKITLRANTKVRSIGAKQDQQLEVGFAGPQKDYSELFDVVVLATGGSRGGHKLAHSLGHEIVPGVPSLFSFGIKDKRIDDLTGLSVSDAELCLIFDGTQKYVEQGPVLITHWGISGPAVIKLSAWAARALHGENYQVPISINWCQGREGDFFDSLEDARKQHSKRLIHKHPLLEVPNRLWVSLCKASSIGDTLRYAELNREKTERLQREVFAGQYRISSKGQFKEEFVTCGGVRLAEVDLRSMRSKLIPNLYFAGEVLDLDGITGGFNLQAAWTTGFIAGSAL